MVDDFLEGEKDAYTGAVMGEDTAYSVTFPPPFEYCRGGPNLSTPNPEA